jgi:hypothetical protein
VISFAECRFVLSFQIPKMSSAERTNRVKMKPWNADLGHTANDGCLSQCRPKFYGTPYAPLLQHVTVFLCGASPLDIMKYIGFLQGLAGSQKFRDSSDKTWILPAKDLSASDENTKPDGLAENYNPQTANPQRIPKITSLGSLARLAGMITFFPVGFWSPCWFGCVYTLTHWTWKSNEMQPVSASEYSAYSSLRSDDLQSNIYIFIYIHIHIYIVCIYIYM